MNGTGRARVVAVVIAMLLVAKPGGAAAQLSFLTTLGYGGAGLVGGALLTSGAECTNDDFICVPVELVVATLAGGVAGGLLGRSLGRGAERDVQAGRPARHLGAVSVGAVLGGGVLGVATAAVLIDTTGDEYGAGTVLGSDERTMWVLGIAGAGLSVLYLRSRWSELKTGSVTVAPTQIDGEPGLRVSVRF